MVVPKRPSSLLDYLLDARESSAQAGVPEVLRPFVAQLMLLSRMSGLDPLALYEGPAPLR